MKSADKTKGHSLSPAQAGIWMAQVLDPDNPVFNIAEYIEIGGAVMPCVFESALRRVISEAEALHVRVGEVDGKSRQYMVPDEGWQFLFMDVSSECDPQSVAESWMRADLACAVDLRKDRLFAYALFRLSSDRYFWYSRNHHLCNDGFGGLLVAQQVAAVYSALMKGGKPPEALPPYSELLEEEERYRNSSQYLRDREYWRTQLPEIPEIVTLSGKPPARSRRFLRSTHIIPHEIEIILRSVAKTQGATLAQVIIAAATLYLHRMTGAQDVVLGIPLTARVGRKMRSTPGMVSNVLPLRLSIDPTDCFADLLRQTGYKMRAMVRRQRYRGEDIRRDMGLRPDEPDVYGLMVNVMSFDYDLCFAGHKAHTHNLSNGPVDEFSIALYDRKDGSALRLDLDANAEHYSDEEVARHHRRLLHLLGQLSNTETPLHRFELLLENEQTTLLEQFNATYWQIEEATLPQLFEAQVTRTPMATALVAGQEELSYTELNRRANQLAHVLVKMGVAPEMLVGICVKRSAPMVIALLAVLKAGGAYVPLDPEYPQQRLAQMLKEAAPKVVLSSDALRPRLPQGTSILNLDAAETLCSINNAPDNNFRSALLPEHPAYVIFTSGSTGRPKGVVIEHRSTATFISWAGSVFTAEEWAGVLASTSISFDLSVFELFATLAHGGTVLLAESALQLLQLDARERVRLINTVPSAAHSLLDSGGLPDGVRTINLAGEALRNSLVQQLYAAGHVEKVYNLYGPSEDTTYSTFILCPRGVFEEPAIGRPIWNTQAYVLDSSLQLLPSGAAGELYVAGRGLARGYLNQPGLTAERFIPDPFGVPGERMYRTEDLARWRQDGTLEYLGRADQQVKIRGFRIELGEIEAALSAAPEVGGAAVIARENGASGKEIIAYVAPANGNMPDQVLLRQALSERLPAYMMPSAFVVLEALPLTPNGKLDRRALPEPQRQTHACRAPRTTEEEILCGLFAEVLSLERVGIDDDFFALGGHSLMAMRLISRIRNLLEVELSIEAFFHAPTVAKLAASFTRPETSKLRLEATARPGQVPVTYSQQRLWFIDQLENSTQYHIPEVWRLRGALDLPALRQAIHGIVERHEILRTHFSHMEGELVQIIEADFAIDIPIQDMTLLTASEQQEAVTAAVREEWERSFDLAQGPLLRLKLLKLGEQDYILLRTAHHIVFDGWSESIFDRELAELYSTACEARPHSLGPLPLQYADFALWQRRNLSGGLFAAELDYWREKLSGIPEELALPKDRPRQARQTFAASMFHASLPAAHLKALHELGRAEHATLYMTLLTAFSVLLGRYSGQNDIVVGSPVANRPDPRLEELIGYFASALVMRTRVDWNTGFRDLLGRVRSGALEAYRHQDIPFEQLVEIISPGRNLSVPPVFQVMLVLQNAPSAPQALNGVEVERLVPHEVRVRLDLELYAWEDAGTLQLYWLWNRDLFDSWRMEQMAVHFIQLLNEAATHPEKSVGRLEMMSKEERQQLLLEWNDTAAPYAYDRCCHHLFQEQARKFPSRVAAEFAGSQLNYAVLDSRSNQLANYLINLGVRQETRVGICAERGLEMLAGLLGILKAGAAYVPLDPAYPGERLLFMLEDSGADVLLTQNKLRDLFAASAKQRIIALDGDWEQIASESENAPRVHVDECNLAYLIYTSGSTGKPKGVAVEHRQLANQLFWSSAALGLNADDRVLQKASFSFDASILEIFLPLACGATIVAAKPGGEQDADYLLRLAIEKGVTYVDLVPTLLQALLENPFIHKWTSLRVMSSGGEALKPELVHEFYRKLPRAVLWNTYGPTEATVQCTWTECPQRESTISIGMPIANTQAYVLDEEMEPVPLGVTGELHIGGAGVARGYWQRPELTAEKFVPDPFGAVPGARLYRTGDLARWSTHGELEFTGRADQQVKLRGFRIELSEIEAVLRKCEHVSEALVMVRAESGQKQLVAYIVTAGPQETAKTEILYRHLRQSLPEYMVPAAFVLLDSWPLTPNGKLDRRALPVPERQRVEGHHPPRTPEEEILCGAFASVLSVERMGIHDNFFALGGHSLMAARLVNMVRSAFGVEIGIRTLFEAPTVAQLASQLRFANAARRPLIRQPRPERLPLSYAQQRLWFIDRMEGPSATYNIPLALRLEGDLDQHALEQALADVAARHETLRTIFPELNGVPHQHVLPVDQASLVLVGEPVNETELGGRLSEAAATGIQLNREMPVKAWLFEISRQSHMLLLLLHHIAADGWSMGPLGRDIQQAYSARVSGKRPHLQELPVQYADYTLWQRELLSGSLLADQLAFWRKALAGAPEELSLPSDRPRPRVSSHRGAVVQFEISAELHGRLLALARSSGASLFMVLHAGLAVLLSRMNSGEDIPIGAIIAGRNESVVEDLVGFFVNTLVMRTDLSGGPDFLEAVRRVRKFALEAYAHQDVPFERLIDELQPVRSQSRHPLFQVAMALQNAPAARLNLPGLKVKQERLPVTTAKFDLLFTLTEQFADNGKPGGICGELEHSSELFDLSTAESLAARFVRLLQQAATTPEKPIAEIDLLTVQERIMLLEDFNATTRPVGSPSLAELFEQQAAAVPHRDALIFATDHVTYSQLNERANRLAHYLIGLGVGPESLAGVAMERSVEMVVALLATLKAGAAYLPLDPDYPQARITQMLDDAAPVVVLTSGELFSNLPQRNGTRLLSIDSIALQSELAKAPAHDPAVALLPQHPAYAIYTSGSTGKPKGAVISHQAIVNRLLWMQAEYGLEADDRVLQKTPFSFDVSVWEFFWPLLTGATLVMARPGGHQDPHYLASLIPELSVTTVHFVPSMLHAFLQEPLSRRCGCLRRVICSGEALTSELQRQFFQTLNVPLHNLYGPTEAAVDVSFWRCRQNEDGPVPIGRPVWNIRMYVLDAALQPVPAGVPGELYLSGIGLARGYLNRPSLTAERFVADPFAAAGARMYRTGDLARWRADGALEYLGRVDHQAKIHGLRIELGEIESALLAEPGIIQAAMVVREHGPGEKQLVAYIVGSASCPLDVDSLRRSLSTKLPEYMVPTRFVVLDALPLTASGKLDRKALPAPRVEKKSYRPARTLEEQTISRIFAEVLSLEQVGIDDNFFNLGGDSILSIQVVSRARSAGLELTPRDIFEHPTVEMLALVAKKIASSEHSQGCESGIGKLIATPIIRWLLETGSFKSFHQSVMLRTPERLSEQDLLRIMQAVLDAHDILRLQVGQDGSLFIRPHGSVIAEECLSIQQYENGQTAADRLDPYTGALLQAVWFVEDHRLLFIIHHLAVDGVSWRILISDLAAAWDAITEGKEPVLQPVPVPFRSWARHLHDQANTVSVEKDLVTWESILDRGAPLLPEAVFDPAVDTMDTVHHLQTRVLPALSADLLTTVTAKLHAQINDVLLTALALAFAGWRQNSHPVLVEIEGHGRESGETGLDISRTVGWFTTVFPIALEIGHFDEPAANLGRTFKRVKDQLRAVPQRGLTYGLLRYLNVKSGRQLASQPKPQVAFNYLGRISAGSASDWSAVDESAFSAGADPQMPAPHLLELNAITVDGNDGPSLIGSWSWAGRHLHEREVRSLADLWQKALEALVQYAREAGAGGHSASDFPLAKLTLEQVEAIEGFCPELQDVLPLAPLQEGLLFHAVYDQSATDVYTVQTSLELEGTIDAVRLKQACTLLLKRHSNLRARIVHEGLERPVQIIPRSATLHWREQDFSAMPAVVRQSEWEEFIAEDRRQRFDLASGPLLRFALLRLEAERFVFLLTNHHLLLDGWSMPVLIKEVFELYRSNGEAKLPGVAPYSGYLAWLAVQDHAAALARWREYLAGIDAPTLMVSSWHEGEPPHPPKAFHCALPVSLSEELNKTAQAHGITTSTLMQGLWAVLLARMTGQNDVIFGITVSGRNAELPGIERMLGLLINTVPMRVQLQPEESLMSLLARIQAAQARMIAVQHVRLPEIQRQAGLGVLFDTITVFENYPLDREGLSDALGDLKLAHASMNDATHYPLALAIAPGEEYHLRFDYNPRRFSGEFIEALSRRYVQLVEQAIVAPQSYIYRLSVLLDDEPQKLLQDYNRTASQIAEATFPELFEAQAARTPAAVALVAGRYSLTYGELNARANQLAHYLAGQRIGPESLVGIALERSPEMIVAVLAVMKAGSAYLPLDPEYPQARLAYMIQDAAPATVITSESSIYRLPQMENAKVLSINGQETVSLLATMPEHNPTNDERIARLSVQHPVYVIYTSGSTGAPKGVLVTHAGISSMAHAQAERLNVTCNSRVLQFASLNFDASFWEMVMAFASAAALVLIEGERGGASLREALVTQRVTHALLPLAVLESLEEFPDLPLECLTNGGEALPGEVVARWSGGRRMVNAYGPTETTVCATMSAPLSGKAKPPIGSPILNMQVFVLDANLELTPPGVAGELYISGAGLARGYLNRPGLTAERFVANPFVPRGTRMYRSGDVARWREDGTLEFIGRADQQVKVRGFRIELGEIEAALLAHSEIAQAAVAAMDKQLIAYLVPRNGNLPATAELRHALSQQLPDYMVPAVFVSLPALPLTPNGKLDRGALPRPARNNQSYCAPRTSDEAALCAFFAELLGAEQVGIDDDLFALGGHSLLAMRLVGRIRSHFAVELSLRDLYNASTVRELSEVIQMLLFRGAYSTAPEHAAHEIVEEEEI
jgi:amino acid adenylation domain-containing protein/non-ribosomal peptide synthase protein (TIGR01720 family)